MRRIFNTLEEPTPKPCLAEKAAFEEAIETWQDALFLLLSLEGNNEIKNAMLAQMKKWKTEMEAANKVIASRIKEAFATIASFQKGILNATNKYQKSAFEKGIKDLQEKIITDNNIRDCYGKNISGFNEVIPLYEAEIAQNVIDIEAQTTVVSTAETAMNDADLALSDCLSSPLHIRLNLNSSCKELKQNIKTVNQKSIYLNNKLINLNSGVSSLEILNINKDLLDKNIKNTKEFIISLDELNPNPKPSDSSFFDVYKKAQEDLASYQEKRKTLKSKIKISEEKIKTIPDKQNALEDKTSNKIQKFVNCKTPVI